MQISPETFRKKPLRVHSFLSDVALHDVWAFHLVSTPEPHTLHDFRILWLSQDMEQSSRIVRGLFWLRGVLGRLFRWDDTGDGRPSSSYSTRLTEADRAQSIAPPGSPSGGPFQLVYEFDNEALDEVMNATVHAFSLMAMEPAPHGYTVYWAIYVKPVSWLTPVYMKLIDPFRRLFVYPSLIKRMEAAWASAYQGDE